MLSTQFSDTNPYVSIAKDELTEMLLFENLFHQKMSSNFFFISLQALYQSDRKSIGWANFCDSFKSIWNLRCCLPSLLLTHGSRSLLNFSVVVVCKRAESTKNSDLPVEPLTANWSGKRIECSRETKAYSVSCTCVLPVRIRHCLGCSLRLCVCVCECIRSFCWCVCVNGQTSLSRTNEYMCILSTDQAKALKSAQTDGYNIEDDVYHSHSINWITFFVCLKVCMCYSRLQHIWMHKYIGRHQQPSRVQHQIEYVYACRDDDHATHRTDTTDSLGESAFVYRFNGFVHFIMYYIIYGVTWVPWVGILWLILSKSKYGGLREYTSPAIQLQSAAYAFVCVLGFLPFQSFLFFLR